MLKRQLGYIIVLSFAAVMLVLLMQDDPAARQEAFQAVQQAQQSILLFPQAEQIYGLNVRDVTSGEDILLLRNAQGLWYAPEIEGELAATVTQAADLAASALSQMAALERFEADESNQEQFGFLTRRRYQVGFTVDPQGEYGYRAWIGDTSPNNVAYYVWPETDQYIYLVPKSIVDPVLNMLPSLFVPATEEPSLESTVPVP
ncbi:MAG TPA: hypothetical protein VHP83_12380 [Aggregatilineaceae bacterium]|nr:hypothetical protein [Aggregatilineaceae bacterium]